MQTLNEFLGQYYELFADLETNKAQLSEQFYFAARKLLLNQFNDAASAFLDEQLLAFAEPRFELRYRVANYVPRRRWLFWWNRKAKVLLKQYKAEFEKHLAAISVVQNNADKTDTAVSGAITPTSALPTQSDNSIKKRATRRTKRRKGSD